jgi:hypothetical protein
MTGRYFTFCVSLFGREAAAEVLPALAPGGDARHFSGWRPVVRSLTVRYYPRAALADSRIIAPHAIEKWGRLDWAARMPEGSSVTVDVLAEDGSTLLSNAMPGTDLHPAVDAYRHPAIRLQARLASGPTARPALLSWGVGWNQPAGVLTLDRADFRPSTGEIVRGLGRVDRVGRIRVRIHDAKGRLVARLKDCATGQRAAAFSWDGYDVRRKQVPPGEYFVSISTPREVGTRRVRVVQ